MVKNAAEGVRMVRVGVVGRQKGMEESGRRWWNSKGTFSRMSRRCTCIGTNTTYWSMVVP